MVDNKPNDKCFIHTALEDFQNITKSPELFLSVVPVNENKIKSLLKQSYDFTKTEEPKSIKSRALPELIVQNFDLEQIWQQLELQNDSHLTRSLTRVSKLVVGRDSLVFGELQNQMEVDDGIENELSIEDQDQNETGSESEIEPDVPPVANETASDELSLNSEDLSDEERPSNNQRRSVVDDGFFKLDEMEAFLRSEEKKLEEKEPDSGNDSESNEDEDLEEDVDLFKDDFGDMETDETVRGSKNNPKYKEFFRDAGEPEKKRGRNKFMEENDSSDEDDDGADGFVDGHDDEVEVEEQKSSLEQREERLKRRMEQIEQAAISDKPWQLRGEVTADGRPQNSLLEEIVEFDMTTRPAPVITEETTMLLEDIIRQRIKDKAFDSVERKAKPADTPLEYKKKLVLDQEKSKQSLAQIYEKEFLEQREALDPAAEDKEAEEPKEHKEIKAMIHGLFSKLDALSNFHFTPKAAVPEAKIISNLPAIQMEEVAPIAMSDAALLAPEEIKGKVRGDIIGKTERTSTDKNRERRKKKDKQRKHATEKQKKENLISKMKPGLGNKYSKEKAKKMLDQVTKERNIDKMDESTGSKGIKSSTAFFTQLQDEVTSQIKSKTKPNRNSKNKSHLEAKKLKL